VERRSDGTGEEAGGRTARVTVTRSLRLPDPLRLERFRRVPELGPRILFFSGGTALRDVSRRIVEYSHDTIHLITPFDSGGSSAKLREAFGMPAVGDLRNRLMALADQTVRGQPDIYRLFSFRFPGDGDRAELRDALDAMIRGEDPLVAAIPDPMRKIIRTHLRFFAEQMPGDFDLRGANIGNLILAGGYLNQGRHVDPVIFLFSRLVEVRGVVRPITSADLHLAARLEDGSLVVGQHLLTGKEVEPISSPIRELFLVRGPLDPTPLRPAIRPKVRGLIAEAEVICYPMGSFFTSVLANLLPRGVGRAVAGSDAPKVFIPGTGHDPETLGTSLAERVEILLETLRADCGGAAADADLLQYVLVDVEASGWPASELERIRRTGVRVLDTSLVTEGSSPLLDATRVAEMLVSLV
jgi:CofD-related protein of GAK system